MILLPDKITEHDEFPDDFGRTTDRVHTRTNALGISAASFAKAMSKAFADATTGGKKFDDVLRQLALRLSDMAVAQAFQPLARNLAGGARRSFSRRFRRGTDARGRRGGAPDSISQMDKLSGLTAFASGGVIATPAYFPLGPGGLGVAGEAGPEAILPLARGSDGRLGVAMSGSRGGERHRAHRYAGRGQLPPLGGLHHRTDRARGGAGTARLLKKIVIEQWAARGWPFCFGRVCALFWPLRIRIQRSSRENQGRLKDCGRAHRYRPAIKYDDLFEESANVIKFASP